MLRDVLDLEYRVAAEIVPPYNPAFLKRVGPELSAPLRYGLVEILARDHGQRIISIGAPFIPLRFSAATWLRITQVIGLGFLFVPITLVAYIGVSPEKNNAVAGIINFMRNMGSRVGTSLVTTLIARRSQFHQARLVENVRVDNPNFVNSANGLAQHLAHSGVGKHEAQISAYARIYRSLQAQAASLAYIETFMVLCMGAAIMFCLAFVLTKNDPGGGGPRVVE